jgi:hypothetical protein
MAVGALAFIVVDWLVFVMTALAVVVTGVIEAQL